MALIIKDRVVETSTSTGTGDITLAGALTGFRAFSAVCAVGDTFYYVIEAIDTSGAPTGDWETGYGTYSAANTLTRTAISDSSTGSAVSFGAGTKRVSIAAIATLITGAPVLISEVVTSASAASVTFSSIPGAFRDLQVRVRGRGSTSAANVEVRLQFNSDTGSNYYWGLTEVSGGAAAAQAGGAPDTSIFIGRIPAATATANAAGLVITDIGDYRGTTFDKQLDSRSAIKTGTATTNQLMDKVAGTWHSTSAIATVKVLTGAGNFVDGSVVSLYGQL